MKKKHLKLNNLPPTLTMNTALLWWLALDYFKAPGWAFGVAMTLYAVIELHHLIRLFTETEVDLLGNEKP